MSRTIIDLGAHPWLSTAYGRWFDMLGYLGHRFPCGDDDCGQCAHTADLRENCMWTRPMREPRALDLATLLPKGQLTLPWDA